MKSALKTNPLTIIIVIALLSSISGCAILPSGPDKKPETPQEPAFTVQIDHVKGTYDSGVYQGHYLNATITTTYERGRIDGFDLLIAYEPEILTAIEVNPGDYFLADDWEYFEYEITSDTLERAGGVIGLIRITALRDDDTTTAQKIEDDSLSSSIAVMKYFVTNDRSYYCRHSPLRFFWKECSDNQLFLNEEGKTAYAMNIHNILGTELKPDSLLNPGWYGPQSSCFSPKLSAKMMPADFVNGGIDIICYGPIDCRGDLNANGMNNEIADAVMFAQYFLVGLEAFSDQVEASIACSDVNADSIKLSAADLVYLIRIIIGDAIPYYYLQPGRDLTISTRVSGNELIVNYNTNHDIGAVWLLFNVAGEIGTPQLAMNTGNMELLYHEETGQLRVLIYNIGINSIPPGNDKLLTIPFTGLLWLTEADAGDYQGASMKTSINNMIPENGSQR